MDFLEATDAMRKGHIVRRRGWLGHDRIKIHAPGEYSASARPFLIVTDVIGRRAPWLANKSDELADDWEIVDAQRC